MTQLLEQGSYIDLSVGNNRLSFTLLHSQDITAIAENLAKDNLSSVNVFASGPSIAQVDFNKILLNSPAIFVNGSLSLLTQYHFNLPIAYVISDERFIEHNLAAIKNNITKTLPQTLWCITLPVLKALCKADPKLVQSLHPQIRLIFAVDRPIINQSNFFRQLFDKDNKFQLIKHDLAKLVHQLPHEKFIINSQHDPIIGVSLDITQGFIEAGTVAFVACQLAFSLKFTEIHLYGVDLSNSQQPRFYETTQNQAPSKLDKAIENRIVPSFNLMATSFAKRGTQVYNHSPFSKDLFLHFPYLG